jgi:hypothetical protein
VPVGLTPTYDWRQVSGATVTLNGSTSAKPTFATALPGVYVFSLIVRAGLLESEPDSVTVVVGSAAAPSITQQPQSISVKRGETGVLSVTATGIPTPTYQWRKNGTVIAGATAPQLTIINIQPADAGSYSVIVSNVSGSVASASVAVVVQVAIAIAQHPTEIDVPAGQAAQFTVTAIGQTALSYQWQASSNGGATWLPLPAAAPYSGTTGPQLTIGATDISLNGTLYRCVASNTLGTAASAAARLAVHGPAGVSPSGILFGATRIGGSTDLITVTSPQDVHIAFTGAPSQWTATADQPWIQFSTSGGVLTVDIARPASILGNGTRLNGQVVVTAPQAPNSPIAIPVSVAIREDGVSDDPIGTVDTPVDGVQQVSGSIAVTGWALDDVEIAAVRVLRDPVQGEGNTLVFVGNAVLVDGARPDVAAIQATLPRNTRAGWGYLLLTNMLPNQGNGTFRLHAFADDADGHSVLLGTRTITCTNATATTPFGAIDTPGQGEVVSGLVNNFGWVLAPGNSRADVPGGATVNVVIDGVAVGTPAGWTNRSDLTTLFPSGYSDLSSALAVYTFDSLEYSNGVHTIAWGVTATNGQSEGIGSRFFTVSNGAAALTAGTVEAAAHAGSSLVIAAEDVPAAPAATDVGNVPLSRPPVLARVGWDESRVPLAYEPDEGGRVVINGEELGLFDVTLGSTAGPVSYTGYLRAGNDLSPLPIGARLDATTGRFTWQPGVAFIGAYDFVFVASAAGQAVTRQEVRIVLHPKGSNRIGPQVVIDRPAANAEVPRRFLVAGWAIDLDDPVGTGIDTLHVWAYPVGVPDTTEPIFLGAASYGGLRPDVAALHGDRFRPSGYGLFVESLPPGTYDVAVFAWSTARNEFVPAKVVRITIR